MPSCIKCNLELKRAELCSSCYGYVWRKKNKDKHAAASKKWEASNKKTLLKRKQEYYINNKDKIDTYRRLWGKENADKAAAAHRKWRKTSVAARLACNLRRRIRSALNRKTKVDSMVNNLGCSIKEFKIYLESRFQPGMSWDNYGFRGWHIDHIRPLSSFDLTKPEELKMACHWSNMQPLWWQDNLKKGGKQCPT